ncbi:sialate:O-sulfotransferase 1-like isoform X2 [Macrobrachium nipponense]|uniref:sialate:O-sulfotransferase 1-like isoform X2 n=1 Tax=Macrobrachium nipponense TaxID=159736 RepID=UPI0030C80D29
MSIGKRTGCGLLCIVLSTFFVYSLHLTSGNIRTFHKVLNAFDMSTNGSQKPWSYPKVSRYDDTIHGNASNGDDSHAKKDGSDEDSSSNDLSNKHVVDVNAGVPQGPARDLSGKIRYPWRNDPQCDKYNIAFAKRMPRAFLVSYPRSGNSWVRYLIEGASGIFTGSKYGNQMLVKMGFLGEDISFKSRRTIINKIHKNSRKKVRDYSKVVLLIRNPAKSIVSYWNYNNNKKGPKRITHNVTADSYKTEGFKKFVKTCIGGWTTVAADRLTFSRKLLVVPYEYLLENPIAQVRRILRFLSVPEDEGRLACLSRHTEGPAKGLQRKVDPYTEEQRKLMAQRVSEIQKLLKSRNMDPLPPYPEIPLQLATQN